MLLHDIPNNKKIRWAHFHFVGPETQTEKWHNSVATQWVGAEACWCNYCEWSPIMRVLWCSLFYQAIHASTIHVRYWKRPAAIIQLPYVPGQSCGEMKLRRQLFFKTFHNMPLSLTASFKLLTVKNISDLELMKVVYLHFWHSLQRESCVRSHAHKLKLEMK